MTETRSVTREWVLEQLDTMIWELDGAALIHRDDEAALAALVRARTKITDERKRCVNEPFHPGVAQRLRELAVELRGTRTPTAAAADIQLAGEELHGFLMTFPLVLGHEWKFEFVT